MVISFKDPSRNCVLFCIFFSIPHKQNTCSTPKGLQKGLCRWSRRSGDTRRATWSGTRSGKRHDCASRVLYFPTSFYTHTTLRSPPLCFSLPEPLCPTGTYPSRLASPLCRRGRSSSPLRSRTTAGPPGWTCLDAAAPCLIGASCRLIRGNSWN
jgi:hypothetical protein